MANEADETQKDRPARVEFHIPRAAAIVATFGVFAFAVGLVVMAVGGYLVNPVLGFAASIIMFAGVVGVRLGIRSFDRNRDGGSAS